MLFLYNYNRQKSIKCQHILHNKSSKKSMTVMHLFSFKLIRIFNVEAQGKIQDKLVGSNRVKTCFTELDDIENIWVRLFSNQPDMFLALNELEA